MRKLKKNWKKLKKEPGKSDISRMLASGVGSGGFCYLLGGQAMDMLAAFLSGFLLYVVLLAFEKREKLHQKLC